MKVIGKITKILAEREETGDRGDIIRKKDFMVTIPKPSTSTDSDRKPDTIGLTLIGARIDQFDIYVGMNASFLYDSNARVSESGEGDEIFSRTSVFQIFNDEK